LLYNHALNDLNKSLEIEPNNTCALRGRGAVYCDLKQYNNALNNFNKLLEIEPNNAWALRGRGCVYSDFKQY